MRTKFSTRMKWANRLQEQYGQGSKWAELPRLRDRIGGRLGVSGRKYQQMLAIWQAAQTGNPQAKRLVKRLDSGQVAVDAAYAELQRSPRAHIEQSWKILERLRGDNCEIVISGNPNPAIREGEHGWEVEIYTGTATTSRVFSAHVDHLETLADTLSGLAKQVGGQA